MLIKSVPLPADGLDRRGYKRSPVTRPEFRQGREPLNKGRRYPVEILTSREVRALLDACHGPASLRNRALIMLLWRTGLRCSEALALDPKDLDLATGRITVLHGKGNQRRIVGCDPETAQLLADWVAARRRLPDGLLFCVITPPTAGLPLQAPYLRDLLKGLARAAGVRKRVHPHGLRHTYAAHLLEQGVPVHYIRRMLGHSSLAITEHYCDHLTPLQALERVRAVSWPPPAPDPPPASTTPPTSAGATSSTPATAARPAAPERSPQRPGATWTGPPGLRVAWR